MHTEYGPHTSTWIKENGSAHILLREGKDNLFCLANGQIVHISVHLWEKEGKTSFKTDSLWKERCPNLKCHKIDISLFETEAERADLRFLLVEARFDREGAVLELDFYSKYTRQRGKLCVSWLTDKRLNEKDGT